MAKSTRKAAAKKKAKPTAKPVAKAKPTPAKTAKSKPAPKAKVAAKPVVKAAPARSPVKQTPAKVAPSKVVAAKAAPVKVTAAKVAPASKPGVPSAKQVIIKSNIPKGPAVGSQMLKPATLGRTRIKSSLAGKSSNGKAAKPTVPQIIPPPPPPRSKPGKNLAGLNTKELEFFRDMLLAKRRELVGDMYSMEREALQRSGENLSNLPMHMADMGTDNYEQEFTLGLMEKDRQLLREINTALSKIMDGRYGMCEGTGKVISKARLEVQPWAKYSIEHARKLENRGVR